ncbi:MAG: hypothetical protein CMJ75_20415 [Planctomycetaceae bacterium]|nr:hypothetical protein [Planctomycetaceae bacterium]
MKKTRLLIGLVVAATALAQGACADDEPPWWNKEKIRFMWGQWSRIEGDGVPLAKVMENLAAAGATVFVEDGPPDWRRAFVPERLDACRKHGLQHFGLVKVANAVFAAKNTKARLALDRGGRNSFEAKEKGEPAWIAWADWAPAYVACPFDEPTLEEWLVKPALKAAEQGSAGLLVDWEPYATGMDSAGSLLCYCDDCFGNFLRRTNLAEKPTAVPPGKRVQWLRAEGLWDGYLQVLHTRYKDVFRGIASRVRKIRPDFIFSHYCPFIRPGWLENGWRVLAAIEGPNSPEAPSIFVDESHYYPHPTCPWWDLYTRDFHAMGVKHIIGSYLAGWSGGPATAVSLEQYIYEAAINSDGTWTWFDSPLRAAEYRVLRSANRRIAKVESKARDYLLRGKLDFTFACVVEHSGNPRLGENVLQRTYHLKDNHLVHVSNVNIDKPVTVTVRCPRLPDGTTWTVRDPISGIHYLRAGKKPLWSNEQLLGGISLDLGGRSDSWLLLEVATAGARIAPATGVVAELTRHFSKPVRAQAVLPKSSPAGAGSRLVYLKSRTENNAKYPYYSTVRTSLQVMDLNAKAERTLFAAKGNCWSPRWSADGRLLAFSCYAAGKGQITIVAADGSRDYNASNNDFSDHSPAWSPDGKQLAFVSDRDGDWEIYRMNADGSDQVRLTTSPGMDRAPRWSPDGKRVVFETVRQGGSDIWLMNRDGSAQHSIVHKPGNERAPVWSPDGKWIACTFQAVGDRRSLLLTNVEDGSSRVFFAPWGIRYTNISSVSWSPDGNRLAGVFQGGKNNSDTVRAGLFVINADGSGHREIVSKGPQRPRTGGEQKGKMTGAGWYSDYSTSQRWVLRSFSGITWSPDSAQIAFSSDLDESGDFYVYTIPAGGGDAIRIDVTRSAWAQWCTWSP